MLLAAVPPCAKCPRSRRQSRLNAIVKLRLCKESESYQQNDERSAVEEQPRLSPLSSHSSKRSRRQFLSSRRCFAVHHRSQPRTRAKQPEFVRRASTCTD